MARKRHKAEEIVAKLRQVDVLVSQGQSGGILLAGVNGPAELLLLYSGLIDQPPFAWHPRCGRERSCGALASLRGRLRPPHDGIRGSGRNHLSRAIGLARRLSFRGLARSPRPRRDLLHAGGVQCQ